jgi:Uri superfamily endonuclease
VVEDAKPGGTYVLLLKNSRMKRIRIGKLGVLLFGKGFYAYFGSMFGPGGLKSRIRRRLRKKKSIGT